jgi:uncharacterized cupin superfamily protein
MAAPCRVAGSRKGDLGEGGRHSSLRSKRKGTMPKIDTSDWTEHPEKPTSPFGQGNGPYGEIVLGDATGLTQFGARLERLPPGSKSSYRHWHETEDELVYVLSGELILVEDVETSLHAGDVAGWKAGDPVGHCLHNQSSDDAVILVLGTRAAADVVHYPDHDLILHRDATGRRYSTTDGAPVEQ